MKKVYQAVSEMILPGIVFAAVMSILVGAALFARIGGRMETEAEDYSRMADTQAVQALCERELPVIRCVGRKRWDDGESIFVPEVFAASDAEGNNIEVAVIDITDQNGNSAMGCYSKETKEAVFSARGVYTFLISATDGQQKRSTGRFSILVDRKQ